MDTKIFVLLLLAANCFFTHAAQLRRTPKVYNALITTDENLTSSRAYPVIQPTIHETGIASYPFGPFNPYGVYSNSLLRFGQPLIPGLTPRDQLPNPFLPPNLQPYQPYQPQQQPPPQVPQQYQPQPPQQPPPSGPPPQNLPPSGPSSVPPSGPQSLLPSGPPSYPPSGPPSLPPTAPPPFEPQSQNEVIPPPSPSASELSPWPMPGQNPPQMQPSEKLPIPLNEYGLPPSLVPLQHYPPQRHRQPLPLNLAPYPYQNFPVLYEPYNGYPEHYLPPFGHFPSHTYGIAAAPPRSPNPPPQPSPPSASPKTPQPEPPRDQDPNQDQQPEPSTPEPTKVQLPAEVPLESIKNGSASNKDVPDVPPPPIPSGGKPLNKA